MPDQDRPFDIAVVSTAAPPWGTGPATLTFPQACGLAALGHRVVYVVPWIPPKDQAWLWGAPIFATPQAQAAWLVDQAEALSGIATAPAIAHYRGRVSRRLRSIVPLEDVFAATPPARRLALTEPEHLCWYPLTRPRRAVPAEVVLGVVMTNYGYYVRRSGVVGAKGLARLITGIHRHLIRRHTDRVVPLSPAVDDVVRGHPTAQVRVTGVVAPYTRVPPVTEATRGVYFIGRLVWEKGLYTVLDVAQRTRVPIAILGDGPDRAAIEARARQMAAPARFLGAAATPWTRLADHRVFLNPSRSEVLCTTTAEALVAGRHVVLADCPANRPFRAYPNTHFFSDIEGAVTGLRRALDTPPAPPEAVRHDFDWEQACRRLADLLTENAAPGG